MHGRNEGERRNGGRGVGGETERERVGREDRMEKGGCIRIVIEVHLNYAYSYSELAF